MMALFAAALGGVGVFCALFRRTLLGVLVGLQLLALGAATLFVHAGAVSGQNVRGHVAALFVVVCGVAQLVAGFSLAMRLFFIRKRAEMTDLRSLRG
jgi:NADH:ubiquinone oxidoreductase subunit K